MRTSSLNAAIDLARLTNGPISKITAGAVEAGIIVPSILKRLLTDVGYSITYHEGPGEDAPEGQHPHGAWVLIKLNDVLAARAYSHDEADALLQAVYGAMREEDGRVVVAEALNTRGFEVTPELRQKLESRYIVGGRDQLEQDLAAFPASITT